MICALGGWGLFRFRVFHVSRNLNRQFEAQLAERTRIAQELHDTLLQGFISASMQLHVAAGRLPSDSHGQARDRSGAGTDGTGHRRGAGCGSRIAVVVHCRARPRGCLRRHPRGAGGGGTHRLSRHHRGGGQAAASDGPRRGLQDRSRSAGERVSPRPSADRRPRARLRAEPTAPARPRRWRRNRSPGRELGDGRALGHRRNARTCGEDRRPVYDQESPRRRHGDRADRAREGRLRSQGDGCGTPAGSHESLARRRKASRRDETKDV